MPELIDKKRTEAKVFLIARFFIDRPDREVELVRAVIHRCCEEIDKQPTIEAEPVRHGRWIPVTNGRGGHECDQCRNYAPSYQTGKEHLSDYCPNCGARMDGGAENA